MAHRERHMDRLVRQYRLLPPEHIRNHFYPAATWWHVTVPYLSELSFHQHHRPSSASSGCVRTVSWGEAGRVCVFCFFFFLLFPHRVGRARGMLPTGESSRQHQRTMLTTHGCHGHGHGNGCHEGQNREGISSSNEPIPTVLMLPISSRFLSQTPATATLLEC